VKVMRELRISHLKSLGARTASLDETSCTQSASVCSKLWVHPDAVSVSSCCDSLPSRVLRYSIIQLSVQIRQRHIMFIVAVHLRASGPVLVDADGVIVLVIWVKSSYLAPNRNLDSGLVWICCLWRLTLIVSP
jgi:hypothetical protein